MEEFNVSEVDLYEILGVSINCSVKEVKKAYRKKALECHPDKNPDNPNAAKLFHQLTKVLEILTDEAARKAYDKVLKAKKEAALRHKELDGKRRKFKEELEARERQASSFGNNTSKGKSDDEKLKDEIERLRKEGSKQVQEEMEFVFKKLAEEQIKGQGTWDSSKHRIKIKWKAAKNDLTNGGYTQDLLHRFLSKYGDIVILVMSPKKAGSALVEFSTQRAAEMAVDLEKGLANNPIHLEWVDGAPSSQRVHQSSTIKPSDYESVVFTKMRQAEERKKLIEQMIAEDNET